MHYRLSIIALLIILLSPLFLTAGKITALMMFVLVCVIFDPHGKVNLNFLSTVAPVLLIIIIGFHGIINNQAYNFFKDIWYICNPIVALAVGYVLMQNIQSLKTLFKIIIIASCISALVHLSNFVINPDLLKENYETVRETAGRGYLIVSFGLAVAVSSQFLSIDIYKNKKLIKVMVFIMTISFILFYSRALWICFLLLLASLFGLWGHLSKKMIILSVIIICISFVSYSVSKNISFKGDDHSFVEKSLYSLQEVLIKDFSDMGCTEIGLRWRGYESYKGLQTYLDGNVFQYLFGKGFGTLVDLGFKIRLGEKAFRFIPVFHNGYIYLLVKTGLLGVILYMYFLIQIIRTGNKYSLSNLRDILLTGRLLSGLGWILIFSTAVIAGFFNKIILIPAVVLIGSCISFLQFSDSEPVNSENFALNHVKT